MGVYKVQVWRKRQLRGSRSAGSNVSVTTVQTITTQASDPFLIPTKCIQLIGTGGTSPKIQSFHTTSDVGTTVSGSFIISHTEELVEWTVPLQDLFLQTSTAASSRQLEDDLPRL